ncbi:hypothetical protein AADR41_27700, partial [Streptomyces sp. CLV115]
MSVRGGRWALGGVMVAEVVLVGCLAAGVRMPAAVLLGARVSAAAMLGFEAVVLGRLLRAGRRAGLGWREASAAALRAVVPEGARRLAAHEVRTLHSLGLWLRGRWHGVPAGAVAVAYTGPQTAMMYGLLFVSVVETVMLALLIPWPLVHGILLVLDVYGVVFVLALHASCVTRPHVVDADGALRLRYGGLFDLRIPAD